MATYEIQFPNGKTEEYDVDDSLSADEAVAKIASVYQNLQGFAENKDPTVNSHTKKLVKDRGFAGSILPAAGEMYDRLWRGAKMGSAFLRWDADEYNKLRKEQDNTNSLMAPLVKENPWGTFVGGSLPLLASSPTSILGVARGAGQLATAPIKGAANLLPQALKAPMAQAGERAASLVPGMVANYVPESLQAVGRGAKVIDALGTQAQNRALLNPMGAKVAAAFNDPIKQAAVTGGIIGSLDPDSTALRGAVSGVAGAGLAKTIMQPFSKKATYLTKPQEKIIKEADDLGIYLYPGTRTGDFRQAKLDRRLAENPTVSTHFDTRELQNNAVVSGHISRELGLPKTNIIDADYLHNGFSHYGKIMNEVGSRTKVKLDDQDIIKMFDVIADYKKFPGTSKLASDWQNYLFKELGVKKIVPTKVGNKVVNKIKWNFKDGELPGDLYQKISTRLNQQISPNLYKEGGDRALGEVLFDLKNILDDGLTKGAHPGDKALLDFARKGYAGLELVRKSTDANSGRVNLSKMYENMTKGNYKGKYDRILKDNLFAKLARIGKLQQETRAKADLATQNISRSILGESPKQVKGAYKLAAWGLGDANPSNFVANNIARTYLNRSGWPAATGFFPVIKPSTSDRIQKTAARAAMAGSPSTEDVWFPDITSIWED